MNDDGEIGGVTVDIVSRDSQAEPNEATWQAQNLIESKGVDGYLSSNAYLCEVNH